MTDATETPADETSAVPSPAPVPTPARIPVPRPPAVRPAVAPVASAPAASLGRVEDDGTVFVGAAVCAAIAAVLSLVLLRDAPVREPAVEETD